MISKNKQDFENKIVHGKQPILLYDGTVMVIVSLVFLSRIFSACLYTVCINDLVFAFAWDQVVKQYEMCVKIIAWK